jgi:hypothetical protein
MPSYEFRNLERNIFTTFYRGLTMQIIASVLLIENSTAGNPPKSFEAQRVEIAHENDTVVQGADGPISRASHPSKVLWVEGKANDLSGITNVKITAADGSVLLDGELNTFHGAPKSTDAGVQFFVLKSGC